MVMKIMNNMVAVSTHNELNRNQSAMSKSLAVLSSGMKINSAQDDASGYSISERMRELIRGLDQGKLNAQNGNLMLNIAAGGVDNIIEELRNLKELAINAQNDTNTDADRATMQKEFEQRVANINEIAVTTKYNGLNLLGGDYGVRIEGEMENTAIDTSDLTKSFKAYENATESDNRMSCCPDQNGGFLEAQRSFVYESYSSPFSVEIDFSHLNLNASAPRALDGTGFIILCGGCSQYLNIKFDGSKTAEESEYNNSIQGNSLAREYTIGIKNVKSSDDLSKAIFEGIQSSRGGSGDSKQIDAAHSVTISKTSDDKYIISKERSGPALQFRTGIIDESGNVQTQENEEYPEEPWGPKVYSPLTIHYGTQSNQSIKVLINDMRTKYLKTRVIYEGDVEILESLENDKEQYETYKNMLLTEKGVMANDIETLERLKEDEEKYEDYKELLKQARKKTLDDVLVTTRENAKVAHRIIDGALEYALNQATTIGAYQ